MRSIEKINAADNSSGNDDIILHCRYGLMHNFHMWDRCLVSSVTAEVTDTKYRHRTMGVTNLPVFPAGASLLVGPSLALIYTNTAKAAEKQTAEVSSWRNLSYTIVTGTL